VSSSNGISLTLLYGNLKVVISAPHQVRGKLHPESRLPSA
jgi:hypothetical protein